MKMKQKIEVLESLIDEIIQQLESSIGQANNAAKGYSEDPTSKLAFEVGYLSSTIKGALSTIAQCKENMERF